MGSVIITGATRGSGKAIAIALAQAGWTVFAVGRDRSALDALRADYGIVPFAFDLTDRDEMRALTSQIRPDAVVHAAMRWPEQASFLNATEAEIDMALEVNLSATLHLTRALLPGLLAAGQGAIILVQPAGEAQSTLVELTVAGAAAAFVQGLRHELAGSQVATAIIYARSADHDEAAEAVLASLGAVRAGIRNDVALSTLQ